jgi:hypothetical protein
MVEEENQSKSTFYRILLPSISKGKRIRGVIVGETPADTVQERINN